MSSILFLEVALLHFLPLDLLFYHNLLFLNYLFYIKLFYPHLKDLEQVDSFYFYSLDNLVHIISKQNVLRAICESYISLIEFEGRLHSDFECLLCELPIENEISLIRGFIPVHSKCILKSRVFEISKIKDLFKEKKSIHLSDSEVEYLWNILLQGL